MFAGELVALLQFLFPDTKKGELRLSFPTLGWGDEWSCQTCPQNYLPIQIIPTDIIVVTNVNHAITRTIKRFQPTE